MNPAQRSPRVPRTALGVALLTAAYGLTACGGGGGGDPENRGAFQVQLISTGVGQVYPYRIRQIDSLGTPTSVVLMACPAW